MAYPNNTNRELEAQRRMNRQIDERDGSGLRSVLLAPLAALAIVLGIFYMMDRKGTNVANSHAGRPAVTTNFATEYPVGVGREP
jgi:hypothetical protein